MSNKNECMTESNIEPKWKPIDTVDELQKIDNSGDAGPNNILSCRKLKEITKCEDLEQVISLEMCIDSQKMLLGNFGMMIPNLRYLKLTNSNISSIRELGSSFNNLGVLWMSRCSLKSTDGLENMKEIRELYLSFNKISDISACGMLTSLQILDLEGNQLHDKNNISFLAMCPQLTSLNLENNPLRKQFNSYLKYWTFVKNQLPNIKCLDNICTKSSSVPKEVPIEYNFQDDWKYINEIIKEISTSRSIPIGQQIGNEVAADTLSQKSLDVQSMELSLKPVSLPHPNLEEKQLYLDIPEEIMLDSEIEASDQSRWATTLPAIDTANSNLTTGGVICGDIAKALRQRRNSISTPRRNFTVILKPVEKERDETIVYCESNAGECNAAGEQPEIGQITQIEHDEGETDSGMMSSRISSRCEAVSESELDIDTIEALQLSCTEVLKELENWKREFNKCSKKNLVCGINPVSNPELSSLREMAVSTLKPLASISGTRVCGSSQPRQGSRDLLHSGNQSTQSSYSSSNQVPSGQTTVTLSRSLQPKLDLVTTSRLRTKAIASATNATNESANRLKAKLGVQRSNIISAKIVPTNPDSSHNMVSFKEVYPNKVGRYRPMAAAETSQVGSSQKTHSRSRIAPDAREVQNPAASSSVSERDRVRNRPTLPSKPCIKQGNL